MPDLTYEIRIDDEDEERGETRAFQVIAYDGEGENLGGVVVRLEIDANGSFEADSLVTRMQVTTNPRGKALLRWHEWPPGTAPADGVSRVKAAWEGQDPFVFIERFRESDPSSLKSFA